MKSLKDTTFAIIFKCDSNERLENIKLVHAFISESFDCNIDIIEAAAKPVLETFAEHNPSTKYKFIVDDSASFNMTKYRNEQIQNCKTKFIALWDTDVIISPMQVYDSILNLRSGRFQVAYPYDGNLIEINSHLKKTYRKFKDLDLIEKILARSPSMYGNISVGAAVIFNTEFYKQAGMDNKHFIKWGHDDLERFKRSQILGAKIFRSQGRAYHLYHPRFNFDNGDQRETDCLYSRSELLKVCSMTSRELQDYIRRWQ